jgi:5-methylcytosine-specific restriction endonuclease McrA
MALPIGTPRPCKGCGTTILKLTFCTNECRVDWYERTKAERWRETAQERGMQSWEERYGAPYGSTNSERDCVVCGSSFRRPKRKVDAALCCSRECGFELIRRRGEVSRRITAEKELYARWSKRAKAPPKPVKLGKVCRGCGTEVPKGTQRCAACRAIADEANKRHARERAKFSEAARAVRRAGKARRKAIERGIHAERFDPFEIFERDRWRCHLCGCKTPKALRGTYQDRAPELDHIIPLSKGGHHTRANTACSCRKCNHAKGDKPLGQMRLVA